MDDWDELLERAQERVGRVLKSKWTLERVLGVGGMAAVYAGLHRNGKRVAVKVLHPELSLIASLRARFLREGYAANTIGHRGVVTVDDDDIAEDGSAFLVMELLEGATLDAKAEAAGGTLPVAEVLRYAVDLLDVLAVAHEKGVVHRDIKPENIFVTNEGVLKVLDFGIARVRDASARAPTATRSGAVMGTPAFMAPEQAKGVSEQIGPHTDLWAVGATMFTLLSGAWVHEAATVNEVLASTIMNPARSLRTVMPAVSTAVAEIVDKSLSREIENRYVDARAMQAAVREAQSKAEDANQVETPRMDSVPKERSSQAILNHAATIPLVSEAPAVSKREGAVAAVTALSAKAPSGTLTAGQGLAAESDSVQSRERPNPTNRSRWLFVGAGVVVVGLVAFLGVRIATGPGTAETRAPQVASSPGDARHSGVVLKPTIQVQPGSAAPPATASETAPQPSASAAPLSVPSASGRPERSWSPPPRPLPSVVPEASAPKPPVDLYDKRH